LIWGNVSVPHGDRVSVAIPAAPAERCAPTPPPRLFLIVAITCAKSRMSNHCPQPGHFM